VPAALSPAVRSVGDFFAREGIFLALIAAPLSPLVSARGDFLSADTLLAIYA